MLLRVSCLFIYLKFLDNFEFDFFLIVTTAESLEGEMKVLKHELDAAQETIKTLSAQVEVLKNKEV